MSVRTTYLKNHKDKKTVMKVFIEPGAGTQKTMLTGQIRDFDDECLILDECLIPLTRLISITPYQN